MSSRGANDARLRTLPAVFVFLVLLATPARAQTLTDGTYGIDLTDLPVLGAPRAVGLGGAFGAVGEGASALPWNPSSAAMRGAWEHDWFEWDVALGGLFPSTMQSSRFFGADGGMDLPTESFTFFDLGLRLQFGPVGVGTLVRPRKFVVPVAGFGNVTITAQTLHSDAALELVDGQIVVGVGLRFANLSMDLGGRNLLAVDGTGFEAGVTYRPTGEAYRLAAVVRTPIVVHRSKVDPMLDAMHSIPRSVGLPWELAFSGGFAFGERPINPTRVVGPRPRERRRLDRLRRQEQTADERAGEDEEDHGDEEDPEPAAPRIVRPRYGLVTGELVMQGRMPDAVGLDGFLLEIRRPWGERVTISPRVGIEGEPWRNRMKLRGGTYLEPARSSVVAPRMHFTHGFDLRLFDMDLFGLMDEAFSVQVTFTGDVAREYASFGVGVGVWH